MIRSLRGSRLVGEEAEQLDTNRGEMDVNEFRDTHLDFNKLLQASTISLGATTPLVGH